MDAQVGARRLRNMCLGYLARPADAEAQATCLAQFRQAACMTDSLAALTALADKPSTARDEALHTFYERAKANNLEHADKKALAYCNNVKPMFDEIRECCDEIERVCDDAEWTLPKYRELLSLS